MFVLGTKCLSVAITSNTHYLFVDERTVGTSGDFASRDFGFTSSTFHFFNQNFISRQRAKLQSLNRLLRTPVEVQNIRPVVWILKKSYSYLTNPRWRHITLASWIVQLSEASHTWPQGRATIPVFESALHDSMIPKLEPVLPVQPTVFPNSLFPPTKLHYCLSSNKKFIISFARYEMKGTYRASVTS